MRIKHSKYKNTGLIYELLVKQIASDLVSRKDSAAISIIRKYYSGDTALVQEYRLYKIIGEGTNLSTTKADSLVSETLKAARKINLKELRELKYKLISEIKDAYGLEDFFSITVPNYRALAAFYCLLEADRSSDLIDPQSIVSNKITLLEHMTGKFQSKQAVEDNLIQEFAAADKDVRLLTFKILLQKFNDRYANFLPEQKQVLRQVISIGSPKTLKEYINGEMSKISTILESFYKGIPKGIEKIKLNEAMKMLKPIAATEKVTDEHLVRVLQFYDLIEELKKV